MENGNDDPAHDLNATGHSLEKRGFLRRMGFMEDGVIRSWRG
jgi:hypothetical protein